MIVARVVLDDRGTISRFEATGHALFAPFGSDMVCAAVSVLARSAYEALAALPESRLEVTAPERGSLEFRMQELPDDMVGRARGIADFLVTGLSGLERDYPGSVRLTLER